MSAVTPSSKLVLGRHSRDDDAIEAIGRYFEGFEKLAKAEQWEEIISQGTVALKAAEATGRKNDEAKICAQLTSTAFYQGDYTLALKYANRCHQLSEEFVDPSLYIRALYLESAVHRALAGKKPNAHAQQRTYQAAVMTAEEAMQIYERQAVVNENLKGKVYFNLGAAHADNPKGNLEKAADCYTKALECFKRVNAVDDIIRTSIRLGKVYLLQKQYNLSQQIISEVRPQISNERLAMHADYLEAQLKLALSDPQNALRIANQGLARARSLGAKEDEARLNALIDSIDKPATLAKVAKTGELLRRGQAATSSKEEKLVIWPLIAAASAIVIGYVAIRIFKAQKD